MVNQPARSLSPDSTSDGIWHDVASTGDLIDGKSILVQINKQPVVVCLSQGQYYAIGHNSNIGNDADALDGNYIPNITYSLK